MSSNGKQWQCQLESPSERLAYLRNSGHLSDLTITFPGNSTVIQAHRLLLAMSSPVFEAMLYGPLAEGDELVLPDDPPEAFEWLLNHLYMNDTQLPHAGLTTKVYMLASKYQLDSVCKICSKVLTNTVTAENFPDMFQIAILMEDQPLLMRCANILEIQTDQVLKSTRMGALEPHALVQILTHKELSPSTEVQVFHALIGWGKAQLATASEEAAAADGASSIKGPPAKDANGVQKADDKGRDTCPIKECQSEEEGTTALRNVVKEFLPHIRFLTLSADEFVVHVIPTRIFTSDEAVSVLMNIKSLAGTPLPPIAPCTSREKRYNTRNTIYYYR